MIAKISLSRMQVLELCGQGHLKTQATERRRIFKGLGEGSGASVKALDPLC